MNEGVFCFVGCSKQTGRVNVVAGVISGSVGSGNGKERCWSGRRHSWNSYMA